MLKCECTIIKSKMSKSNEFKLVMAFQPQRKESHTQANRQPESCTRTGTEAYTGEIRQRKTDFSHTLNVDKYTE